MQLSDFKTYVKQDFKRTDKDTELVQAYNDMVNWVSTFMPVGNYKFQCYVSTTPGIEDYALRSDLIHLIHPLRLLLGSGSSDGGYPMDFITKEEYDRIEPNPNRTDPSGRGRPSKYTIYSRSILVTPIPDVSTYLIEANYSKRRTPLSGDSELTSLGSEWDEVLKWGTLERLYAMLGQYDVSQFWGSKYHTIGANGADIAVGLCKTLFDIERDREGSAIGHIQNNNL